MVRMCVLKLLIGTPIKIHNEIENEVVAMLSVDKKFKSNKGYYIFQCTLVVVILAVLFSMLDFLFDTVLVAALGATSFIVFTGPFKEISKARYVIGGYAIGIIVGLIFFNAFEWLSIAHGLFPVFSALSVGVSMFLMVVFDFEHPPAAGVSLGLMMNGGSIYSVVVALVGILFVLLMRRLLSKLLIDLL